MKIKQLAPDVVKRLRSGVAITSVSQCVEELVWNSIDAGATCIAVRLNLPFFKIQVIDNGCGIPSEQMEMVGNRYFTNKCHSLHDLENLQFSGYRGEALASIKDISSILMIESRTASHANTYCKIFTQGKASRPKKSINERPSKGTTISVFDFMYNMPVRKKSISEALDINECRRMLQCIALMYPQLSFSLESEATRETCLQFKKSQSLPLAFSQLFGKVKVGNLKSFYHQLDNYEINGYISTNYHTSKDLQFLYVNKRCVLKTKLQKLINSILGQVLSCKQRSKGDPLKSTPESPVKSHTLFFIYVINITCPYSKCNIIFEPQKTMIDFSEWDKVLKVTENAIFSYLKSEKLISSVEECASMVLDKNEAPLQSNFDLPSCTNGLFSNAVKRLNLEIGGPAKSNFTECQSKIKVNSFEKAATSNLLSLCNDSSEQNLTEVTDYKRTNTRPAADKISSKMYETKPNLVCLKNTKSILSILDTLKDKSQKAGTSLSVSAGNSETTYSSLSSKVPDIPNRSVFPVESPVMLRVPALSTLSNLDKGKTNTLLKLREKYSFAAKNKAKHLNLGKSTSHKNNIKQNQLQKANKKEIFTNYVTVENKSVQCPSFPNEACLKSSLQPATLDISVTRNKSIQCPSLKNNEKPISETLGMQISADMGSSQSSSVTSINPFHKKGEKIVSRFEFREESNVLLFRKSHLLSRSNRKYLSKSLHVKADETSDSDISGIKRLKSCLSNDSSSPEQNYIREDVTLTYSEANVSLPSSVVHAAKNKNDFSCTLAHKLILNSCAISPDSHQTSYTLSNADFENSNIFLQPFASTSLGLTDDKPCSLDFMDNVQNTVKNDACIESLKEIGEEKSQSSSSAFHASDSPVCVSELVKIAPKMPISSPNSSVTGLFHLKSTTAVSDVQQIDLTAIDNHSDSDFTHSGQELLKNSSPSPKQNDNCANESCGENYFCKDKNFNTRLPLVMQQSNESDSAKGNVPNVFEGREECNNILQQDNRTDKTSSTDTISDQKSNSASCDSETKKLNSRWILQNDPISGRKTYIDSITGNSSYETPECVSEDKDVINQLEKGGNKKHFFLSHDFSPFLSKLSAEISTSNDESACQDQVKLKSKLNNFVKEQEDDEWHRKWRMPQENSETSIEDLLAKWQNPMFEISSEVNCVEDIKYSENLPQMYCVLNSYRFSRHALNDLKVIGQVDCKFIACIISNINENNTNQKLLVLFDQHAVHERVRLEELTEELYATNENNERIVKTSNLTSPLKIMLETEEMRLLQTYYSNLKKLGIHITCNDDTDMIYVHSIPSCLVDKETNKLKRKLSEIEGIIENTIKDWLTMLTKTRTASCILPKQLCSVLNSQACRGSVKFGDPLSISECQELLASLSDCKLPFQCAHGRPSIAPILDLKKIEVLYKKRSPPQLSNIKKSLSNNQA